MKCKLFDVFARRRLNGNGLTVFYDFDHLSREEMLAWTKELRQFESIFVRQERDRFHANIFTMDEELDFAGHPLLGLAYHLHEAYGSREEHQWAIGLNKGTALLSSAWRNNEVIASMHQGPPTFLHMLSGPEERVLYAALNIEKPAEIKSRSEVISTGLPYVILPVIGDLDKIEFRVPDITPLIEPLGAKFLYVLDIKGLEGRTWDNFGRIEDIATGSAAGPAAAFLFKNKLIDNDRITLRQGRFLGRPSDILVRLSVQDSELTDIEVSGNVVKVADIILDES